MPLGYDKNGTVVESEATVVRFMFEKFNEYSKNPPVDIVEAKIESAKATGENITYEEAVERVSIYDINTRIWEEIRENPEFVTAIKEYNKRNKCDVYNDYRGYWIHHFEN